MLVYSGARSCGLNYHFVPGTKSSILQSRLDLPLPKFDHSTKKTCAGAKFWKVRACRFVNDQEISIPCSTLDESFPLVFIASPISADEFEAISSYFAEEPRYFQHHSWIPALLTLPVDKCLYKSNAGRNVLL